MALLLTAPTAMRSAGLSAAEKVGSPAVRKDTGEGGRATDGRGRKNVLLTCTYCGHGPQGHNDGHTAYWVKEAM